MDSSDTDSSFCVTDSDSDLENLYDSECESVNDDIDHEHAVSGWLYEPLRTESDRDDEDHTADTSIEATGPTQPRIGTTDW